MSTVKYSEHRWACHRGHFIAESSIHSEDHLDPGAYYGISSTITGDCKVCGLVDEPHLVPVREREVKLDD